MTNYEKIKNMSIEEMAKEILNQTKSCLECKDFKTDERCFVCTLDYLKSDDKWDTK